MNDSASGDNKKLSDAKRALLAKRLKGKGGSAAPAQAHIPRRESSSASPLSLQQEGLWFLEQINPGTSEYNMPFAFRMQGQISTKQLDTACKALQERHTVLRGHMIADAHQTRFKTSNSLDAMVERLQADDPSHAMQVFSDKPFDFSSAPLWRVGVCSDAEKGDVLVFVFHHSIFDGLSIPLLLRDLSALYLGSESTAKSLPALPIDYGDYAGWQRTQLSGDILKKQREFWISNLSDELPLLGIPLDFARAPTRNAEGAAVSIKVPETLVSELETMAKPFGATAFMALLSVFQVLLCRFSGQWDVIVGSPVSMRQHPDVEELIGFFVNTLPFRSIFSKDMSLGAALETTRTAAGDVLANQDIPFQQIVEAVNPTRDPSRTPIYQALMTYEDHRTEPMTFAGLPMSPLSLDTDAALTDILLEIHRGESETELLLVYARSLYTAATARQLLNYFVLTLRAFCSAPDELVGSFMFLTAEDRDALDACEKTDSEYPRDASLVERFQEQVGLYSDAVAVFAPAEDRSLTYLELHKRSDNVAHRLVDAGVSAGDMVGISCERCANMLAVIVGILKIGAAYVPLDPSYPTNRISLMIEDSAMSVLVADARSAKRLPAFAGMMLDLSDCVQEGNSNQSDKAGQSPCATDPAYVMYTSGSTGTPKGAVVTHRNIMRLVCNTNYIVFSTETRMLHFAPISFDASTLEVWGPLLNGGTVVLCADARPSMQDLGGFIQTHNINAAWLTAELFRMMVDEALPSLAGLRFLLAGGDVLPVAQVQRALEALPDCTLVNGYGPTENTTFTCCHIIRPESLSRTDIPIGRPIANTRVYVLDEYMKRVPRGVAGELYTGGDGVARGYLNRPDLSRERFVTDPFSHNEGTRLYRTGDRVRYLPDGTLAFMGRMDRQIKIRGFRVEPGEIEIALSAYAALLQCVVVAIERRVGDQRLVAYYVLNEGATATSTELRRHLRERVPDYMIPQHFVEVRTIPMTATGKVDRKALPDPLVDVTGPAVIVEPSTPVEHHVASIVAEAIGVDGVSMERNFFELGGHSLLALRVVASIDDTLGIKLSPNDILFNSLQQVASMCSAVSDLKIESAAPTDASTQKGFGRFFRTKKGGTT